MSDHQPSLASYTSGRCQANGVDIHFLRTRGRKPTLIALHGLIGSGACLSPMATALEDDFEVILPDARGHGESSAPTVATPTLRSPQMSLASSKS
jgi:N-formylmaleamate deformylase